MEDLIRNYLELRTQRSQISADMRTLKSKILDRMQQQGIVSYKCDGFKAYLRESSIIDVFHKARFAYEEPQTFARFSSERTLGPAVKITRATISHDSPEQLAFDYGF